MSPQALEQFLCDLPRVGTLLKDRGYRQVWRFEFQGRGYYLKFYPRRHGRLKRLLRGSPARWEFVRLQALQKAAVPAPRAVAHLVGFHLRGQKGDAVILEAIEPAVPLDRYVSELAAQGLPMADHRKLVGKMIQLLRQLGLARLGHDDLHLGNMLLRDGEIYLLDGYAVRLGGLTMANLRKLAHGVRGVATRTDLQRAWNALGPGGALPRYNPVSRRHWRKLMQRTRGENDYFGRLQLDGWRGLFFKQYKYPQRWAPASRLHIGAEDWRRAWPILAGQIQSEQLEVLKRGASGEVLGGEVILGGRPVPIIVKRPFKRHWYRYLNEIGRGSRPWRAWRKAWTLVIRGLPTAWPLLVMQKRRWGYITDSVIVFERVAGAALASYDLDALAAGPREMLFRRTGAILAQIDRLGLSHFDAKASNWIVREDDQTGPAPVLVDVDGIRFRRWRALGIERLLRSMRQHPQYTPADSLALCRGYAPFSRTMIEPEE